ncbi:MAG: metalloregulator ArsR/SmtB family transcription factor [Rhodovarius sp.]|nr:metalloregulator ArsR/SmtB family transcription factor [Rhodovarius sp.]MCX7931876.1 metalloregulator ArsR/SmtB family transcription factor [Rhodovarius sp.]MDW8314479.1 metalloregulator ArsR/SmtB family transcription factor [Rhodovarius sp.]
MSVTAPGLDADPTAPESASLEAKAAEVAQVLRALANERRLLLLCKLAQDGEANVGTLAAFMGLSQPAASQHLARMREEGLVTFRREAQTLYYRIADPRVRALLETLQNLYCS